MSIIYRPDTITREDKLVLIRNLQAGRDKAGELMIPDSEIYSGEFDDHKLELVAKKFFVWLGLKPRGLKFEIDGEDTGIKRNGNKRIMSLSRAHSENEFVSSAAVARMCVEHYLDIKKAPLDSETIELATIEFGLGLFIVNSFNSGDDWSSKLRRFFGRNHSPEVDITILNYLSPEQYAQKLFEYLKTNHLGYRSCLEHLLPWSAESLRNMDSNVRSLKFVDYSQAQHKELSSQRLKATLLVAFLVLTAAFGGFLVGIQGNKLSKEIVSEKESVQILAKGYRICQSSAKIKQKSMDQTDIFNDRQIDADLTRCKSLENVYRFRLDELNKKLGEIGEKPVNY